MRKCKLYVLKILKSKTDWFEVNQINGNGNLVLASLLALQYSTSYFAARMPDTKQLINSECC